jgi:hypothetical protein
MKVCIEFIDENGTRYFYPNSSTATRKYKGWYLPKDMFINCLWAKEILDDDDRQIPYLEQLARTKGWKMEIIPINLQIGTYLSMYKHKSLFYIKYIPILLVIMPLIIIVLISYMGWIK